MILFVIAAAGVAGLMFVANQYQRAFAQRPVQRLGPEDPEMRAARFVAGYLAARSAAQGVLARYHGNVEGNDEAISAYRRERQLAFVSHGMRYDDYASVRRAWRTLAAGGPVQDVALGAALTSQRDALRAAGLGPAEAWDDAVK